MKLMMMPMKMSGDRGLLLVLELVRYWKIKL